MLPPSDSISHQNFKLAEFIANLRQSQHIDRRVPPPPYAPTPSLVPNHEDTLAESEEDDEDNTTASPILIKVDTSITVNGQGNTIMIPTSPTNGSGESHNTQAHSPTSTTQNAQVSQLQQQRQVKSAQLASCIVAALKSSGAFEETDSRRSRPIEISVNAGISIQGDKNVICAGVPRRAESNQDVEITGRKRRASSVSACTCTCIAQPSFIYGHIG